MSHCMESKKKKMSNYYGSFLPGALSSGHVSHSDYNCVISGLMILQFAPQLKSIMVICRCLPYEVSKFSAHRAARVLW